MYKGKKILALIPARGGSKSIPKKNIVELKGEPLISYSIDVAKKSKYVDKVVVSSDDEKNLAVAKKYKAEIIERPKSLAQDRSPMLGALKHALTALADGGNFYPDFIVLFQPTSPLRTVKTINLAIESFISESDKFDFLIPLKLTEAKLGKIKSGFYKPLFYQIGKQRQELEPIYQECGTIFIFKPDVIMKSDVGYGKKVYPFLIENEEEAMDIDSYDDLVIAEYFLSKGKARK